MVKVLRISVERREVVIEGTIGSLVMYGVNEGLRQDAGKFFLSFEASLYEPKVVAGDREISMHCLREGLYILHIPVSGPDVAFTIAVAPKGC